MIMLQEFYTNKISNILHVKSSTMVVSKFSDCGHVAHISCIYRFDEPHLQMVFKSPAIDQFEEPSLVGGSQCLQNHLTFSTLT